MSILVDDKPQLFVAVGEVISPNKLCNFDGKWRVEEPDKTDSNIGQLLLYLVTAHGTCSEWLHLGLE